MSRSLISSGSESESSSERQRRTQDKGTANSQRATFPSAEECLSRLTQLAGLVALGLMTPARANSIRANYREILQYHRQSQIRAEGAGLADADILENPAKRSEHAEYACAAADRGAVGHGHGSRRGRGWRQ